MYRCLFIRFYGVRREYFHPMTFLPALLYNLRLDVCLGFAISVSAVPALSWTEERGHLQLLKRPEGMDKRLWALLQKCWDRVPVHRPTMVEVEIDLRNMQLA